MQGRGIGGKRATPQPLPATGPDPIPRAPGETPITKDPGVGAKGRTRQTSIDWKVLPAAAERELVAHLAELGLSLGPRGPELVSLIAAKELALAQSFDPRVTEADMARAVQRATAAASLVPVPQKSLFGFTSLCDAKLKLDGALLSGLVDRALSRPGVSITDLRVLLKDDAPITGGKPKSDLELAAMLIRQLVLHGGGSAQIALDPERAQFFEQVIQREKVALHKAMGGAGGFCANLASALPQVKAGYFSPEALHSEIRGRFSERVKIYQPSGGASTEGAPRTNYIAEYREGEKLSFLGHERFLIGGQSRALVAKGSSRVILGTSSSFEPGFGAMQDKQLESLAKSQDLLFVVGPHYYTKASPTEAKAKAERLAAQLGRMQTANPELVSHFQYVVPKLAEQEAIVLRELIGAFGSMSLNSVELPGLLGRLRAAGLTSWSGKPDASSEASEAPAAVLSGAIALQDVMKVPRMHVHALLGDLLILDQVKDPQRQVLALLRARQLASMKNANESGQIKSPSDIWPVAPVVKGDGLAGLYAFADALAARFPTLATDPKAYARVIERWFYEDPASGKTYFFVPSRGLHDRTGGSVSTGDTIDASALMLGLEKSSRPKALLHPQSFR